VISIPRAASGALAVTVATVFLAAAASAPAAFTPGSKSLGDPIFPQIGNGGYRVSHYEIDLDYDPPTNRFESGTKTTIAARADQNLSRFSLDFQRDLQIDAVRVNGVTAEKVTRADAKPRLSDDPEVTQPAKLTITPAAGIAKGAPFTVAVAYHGQPREIVDADTSIEGWVRACSSPERCDGSFTVNEPIGAQSWFPSNNVPSDKATFDLRTTAPSAYVAIGAGEQVSRVDNGDGTATTRWVEDRPMATYLATGTVGLFDVQTGSMTDHAGGATIPTLTAVDSAGPVDRKEAVAATAARLPEIVNFTSSHLGPYPFETVGLVADWVPRVGYVLENQTKPHFAGNRGGPSAGPSVLAHEIAHQWMGDSVSPAQWNMIWHSEGWATFFEVLFDHRLNGAEQTPRQFFRAVYEAKPASWRLAPATINGDAAQLFNGFAVYARPGAMLEGLREIIGGNRFFDFARALNATHGYGNIRRDAFIAEAKRASGLHHAGRKRLGRYLRQWLRWERRPRLTPSDF
jgi:aminopeptidase N